MCASVRVMREQLPSLVRQITVLVRRTRHRWFELCCGCQGDSLGLVFSSSGIAKPARGMRRKFGQFLVVKDFSELGIVRRQ